MLLSRAFWLTAPMMERHELFLQANDLPVQPPPLPPDPVRRFYHLLQYPPFLLLARPSVGSCHPLDHDLSFSLRDATIPFRALL